LPDPDAVEVLRPDDLGAQVRVDPTTREVHELETATDLLLRRMHEALTITVADDGPGFYALPRIWHIAVRKALSGSSGIVIERQPMCLSGRTSTAPLSSTSRSFAQS
jgi:hypothetical protein